MTPAEALAELMGKRYDSRAAEHGHHVPGTPYHYKHGWIPLGPHLPQKVKAPATPEAKFKAARASGIEDSHGPTISGMQGSSAIVQFKDGSEYFRKRLSGDWFPLNPKKMADREEAADLIARAVHARAPHIYRTGPDEIHSDMVPGETAIMEFDGEIPQHFFAGPEGRRIALLHILTGDVDVNMGNLMFQGNNMTSIDHSMSWFNNSADTLSDHPKITPGFHQTRSPFQGFVDPADFPPSEKNRMEKELKALKPEFQRIFGGTSEYDQTMQWWQLWRSGRWPKPKSSGF